MSQTASDTISAYALIVSIIAILASIFVAFRQENLSKTAIKLQRDTDLLKWGSDCVRILQEMIEYTFRIETDSKESLENRRTDLLSEVSILIDIGRFYLPNFPSENDDINIPKAYRGFRPVAIDALLYSYRTFKSFELEDKERANELRQYLVNAKREFVSQIVEKLDPSRLMKATGERPVYPQWLHPKELLPKRYQNDDGSEK